MNPAFFVDRSVLSSRVFSSPGEFTSAEVLTVQVILFSKADRMKVAVFLLKVRMKPGNPVGL